MMSTTLRHRIHRFRNWLFKLRDAEAGEVFLHQRRVFIVPTRAGLGFGVMLLVLFIGSINYSLSLGFVLTFLAAACAMVDMHLTFRNLAYLHLAPGRAQPVFAGEDAHYEVHLINRRKYPRYALWLNFVAPDGTPRLAHAADVAAHSRHSVILSAPTLERGWLAAPRIRLQTRFPLGLLHAWSYWQPDIQALVYPQPEEQAPPLPLAGTAQEAGQGQAGHDDFAGIRNYQAGDPMKHLAWRQIAKLAPELGGTLVTKQFEGGAAGELCLDFAQLPRSLDLERKLSRMTRWVLEAEARDLPYAFRLGRISYPAALGPVHLAACLEALALHEVSL